MKITNGIVTAAKISIERGFILSVWLFIEHEDGGTQGFGGYTLGGTPGSGCGEHDKQPNFAAEFIVSAMRACDVEDFDKCVGKSVRVMRENDGWNATIVGIGHIIKNDRWFNAKESMERLSKGAKK